MPASKSRGEAVNAPLPTQSVAEILADKVFALRAEAIPVPVRERAEQLLIDFTGLCVAARNTDYIRALVAASDTDGRCTAIGHAAGFDAGTAALVNGTAAHGEDFDDTFEGGP
ncbi:MAG: MmgE/PrpD family protein, partial [Betaproteobacteria bacterium]|nr:MmgE/PrpD family protein [Betaproteobacteria bacterium]